jgi:hypothetical protein
MLCFLYKFQGLKIDIYCEKRMNTLCGQNRDFLYINSCGTYSNQRALKDKDVFPIVRIQNAVSIILCDCCVEKHMTKYLLWLGS